MTYLQDVEAPEGMVFSVVSEQNITQIVSNFKDVGAGIDGINVKMLKSLLPCILSHLTCLINACLKKSIFPSIFKVALITPKHKSGYKSLFSNYRPISVLPVFSKVLETVMFNQIMSFLSIHNVLFDYQFGFRPKHSTYMPLSLLHDLITANLVEGLTSAGIYLDLARAFDTVNIEILLRKLPKYGIAGPALNLLSSYLSQRIHRRMKALFLDMNQSHVGSHRVQSWDPFSFLCM